MSPVVSLDEQIALRTVRAAVAALERDIVGARKMNCAGRRFSDAVIAEVLTESSRSMVSMWANGLFHLLEAGYWEAAELQAKRGELVATLRLLIAENRGEELPFTSEERFAIRACEAAIAQTAGALGLVRAHLDSGQLCPAEWLAEARENAGAVELQGLASNVATCFGCSSLRGALAFSGAISGAVAVRVELERAAAAGKVATE